MAFFERLALPEIVKRFLQAEADGDSKAVVRQYPALLTQEADNLLARLAHAQNLQKQPEAGELVQELRSLLKRCREIGIDAAYQERERADAEDNLRDALAVLVTADTKEELRATLLAHPELQSEAADRWLAEWQADTSSYGADRIEGWRVLLRTCREHGVDAAIDSYAKYQCDQENRDEIVKQFMDAETPEEQRALIARHPVLLSRWVAGFIDALIDAATQTGSTEFLARMESKKRALKARD